MTSIPMATIF